MLLSLLSMYANSGSSTSTGRSARMARSAGVPSIRGALGRPGNTPPGTAAKATQRTGNMASAHCDMPFANSTPTSIEFSPNAGTSVMPTITIMAFRPVILPSACR